MIQRCLLRLNSIDDMGANSGNLGQFLAEGYGKEFIKKERQQHHHHAEQPRSNKDLFPRDRQDIAKQVTQQIDVVPSPNTCQDDPY